MKHIRSKSSLFILSFLFFSSPLLAQSENIDAKVTNGIFILLLMGLFSFLHYRDPIHLRNIFLHIHPLLRGSQNDIQPSTLDRLTLGGYHSLWIVNCSVIIGFYTSRNLHLKWNTHIAWIVCGLSILGIFTFLLRHFLARVLPTIKILNDYLILRVAVKHLIVILLFPLVCTIIIQDQIIIINLVEKITVFLCIVVFVLGFIKFIKIIRKVQNTNALTFFYYLCCTEFLPIILMIGILMRGF